MMTPSELEKVPAGALIQIEDEEHPCVLAGWIRQDALLGLGESSEFIQYWCLPRQATHVLASAGGTSQIVPVSDVSFSALPTWSVDELLDNQRLRLGRGVDAGRVEGAKRHSPALELRKAATSGKVGALLELRAQIDWNCFDWDDVAPGYSLGEWMHIAAQVAFNDAGDTTLPMFVDMAAAAGRNDVFWLAEPNAVYGPACMEPVNTFIRCGHLKCLGQYLESGLDPVARHSAPLSPLEAATSHEQPAAAALIRSFMARTVANATESCVADVAVQSGPGARRIGA